ncbi:MULTISPECIES: glycosyltransferase family 2 protein [Trichocoleus]|uniref:Glycosyltransferase family 2 protein n=1 Tax=Trichocoleus desertorum GB2-A4 TaxID=2933944 RepID=A0ABV0J9J3_9CYAN|nr:glycosyltransferase family 2 protein [Trichocoleus sp. FACHB-46]MBD1862784.1 glycosyltransferase family 2 protein [Trichocoleus sp. FACHB-46]
MKISIITPTSANRQIHFPGLYHCFKSQTYPDCELLVLDDSPSSSEFFLNLSDPTVKYLQVKQGMTIGEKRNRLVQAAAGEIIVHFDDDDYYAPNYVEIMMNYLKEYDFVTLGGWYAYAPRHDFFCYWDTTQSSKYLFDVKPKLEVRALSLEEVSPEEEHVWLESVLWGYGFSYSYRKSIFDKITFDSVDFGEDIKFVEKVKEANYKTIHFLDQEGLVLHIIHDRNTSGIFPQFSLPSFLLAQIFGLEIIGFLWASQGG